MFSSLSVKAKIYRYDFAKLAKHWQTNFAIINKTFGIDKFLRRITPETVKQEHYVLVALKSFPRLEELNRGLWRIQETGIMNFYIISEHQLPLWVHVNPYKWSKLHIVYVRYCTVVPRS